MTHNIDWLIKRYPQWQTIQSLIRIDSVRKTKKEQTKETRYYIGSLKTPPEEVLKHVRIIGLSRIVYIGH